MKVEVDEGVNEVKRLGLWYNKGASVFLVDLMFHVRGIHILWSTYIT